MVTKPQIYTKNKSLIDFAEIRLKKCIKNEKHSKKKETLYAMLDDYRDGKIAIYWKSGVPYQVIITTDRK